MKIHRVINVSHTIPYHAQPADISAPVLEPPAPVLRPQGLEYDVETVLRRRVKRGTY